MFSMPIQRIVSRVLNYKSFSIKKKFVHLCAFNLLFFYKNQFYELLMDNQWYKSIKIPGSIVLHHPFGGLYFLLLRDF